MSNPVEVKWFTSAMSGAPALSGAAGKLIDLLDDCLIDGFGSVTLASLVVASGVATGTVNTGHGFLDHVVVLIAGATPSGLNGDKRIAVTGTNTFTFDATGISDQTATGTITAKMSPAGWTKTYSGTNKAAYSRSDPAATVMLLRVNDAPEQHSQLVMYESMSDVDTGTGPTPTTSYYSCGKSSSANSTARAWRLFADSRMLYLFVNNGSSTYGTGLVFGDIVPYRSGDAYGCVLGGVTNTDNFYHHPLLEWSNSTFKLARSYTQIGTNVTTTRTGHPKNTSYISNGGSPIPNPVNNAVNIHPVECWESTTHARGLMPGLWTAAHAVDANLDNYILTNLANLTGRRLLYQYFAYSTYPGAPIFDLTGPWR